MFATTRTHLSSNEPAHAMIPHKHRISSNKGSQTMTKHKHWFLTSNDNSSIDCNHQESQYRPYQCRVCQPSAENEIQRTQSPPNFQSSNPAEKCLQQSMSNPCMVSKTISKSWLQQCICCDWHVPKMGRQCSRECLHNHSLSPNADMDSVCCRITPIVISLLDCGNCPSANLTIGIARRTQFRAH